MSMDRPGSGRPDMSRSSEGQPDMDQPADRTGEARPDHQEQPTGWRDPRDAMSPEVRKTYLRGHEPLSDDELAALEARNVERYGSAYNWDTSHTLDDFDDPDDTDAPPDDDTGTRNAQRAGDALEKRDEPDLPERTEVQDAQAERPQPPGYERVVAIREGDTVRMHEHRHEGPWIAERDEGKADSDTLGEKLREEDDSDKSRADKVLRNLRQTASDAVEPVKKQADAVHNAVSNPFPTGHASTRADMPAVHPQHRGIEVGDGVAATGLTMLLLAHAAKAGVDRARARRNEES